MLGTLGQEAESGTGWEGPRHPRRVGWGNRGAEPPERNTTPVGWGGALGRGEEERKRRALLLKVLRAAEAAER